MTKININELSIKEVRDLASDLFPEMTSQDIDNTDEAILRSMVCEELENSPSIDPLGEGEENFETSSSIKHAPSRKKKANRMKKSNKPEKTKHKEDAVKLTRKKVSEEDTSNRSYLNKSSKSYIPDRKLYSL